VVAHLYRFWCPSNKFFTESEEMKDDEEPVVEPTTAWQHLMDEKTSHFYYWNTETNEVTWTIPQVIHCTV